MELDNFDPMILAAECVFEEDEAESRMGGSGMFLDADSALAEEIASESAKRLKKAGAKPLTVKDLAIGASTSGKVAAVAAVSREVTIPEAEITESAHPVGTEAIDPLA